MNQSLELKADTDNAKSSVEERLLSYRFTEDEIKELSLTLARKNQEAAEVDKAKKAITSEYKMKQDFIASEIALLSNKVSTGQTIRDVACAIDWHTPKSGEKTITRLDTQETWIERMTQSEWNLFNQ